MPGPPLCDLDAPVPAALCGAHAAVAALGADRWARAIGRGVTVEVVAEEVLASCLGDSLAEAVCPLAAAREPRQRAPSSVVRCADGYVAMSITTDQDAALLAALVDSGGSCRYRGSLAERVEAWAMRRTGEEIVNEAQAWRLAVVPVRTAEEALQRRAGDARGAFATVVSPHSDASTGSGQALSSHGGRERLRAAQSDRASLRRRRPSPLGDIRVLDLGMVWAGPHAGRLLADLGAEVIKIEGPKRVDGTRRTGKTGGCQGAYADLNRGKRSLVIDLVREEGIDLFLDLVSASDVVLENFSRRVMGNFGLAYESLVQRNPGVIMASLPAFRCTGVEADYVAYGPGIELATGLGGRSPAGVPEAAPVAALDYLSGTFAALGVLAALFARDQSGRGARVEVPQQEVAYELLAFDVQGGATKAARNDGRPWGDDLNLAVLALDGPLVDSGLLSSCEAGDRAHVVRPPWRLSGGASVSGGRAPRYGEDTRALLIGLLGLTPSRTDDLSHSGVVGFDAERSEAVG